MEKGTSIYTVLLKKLSIACRGADSVKPTKAMMTAVNSLTHRFKEINGMSDQRMLISMYAISHISQVFSLMTARQFSFLLVSMSNPKQRSPLTKIRSNGLPASTSSPPTPNQLAKGLVAMENTQMIGTNTAPDTLVDCLRSYLSRQNTNKVQSRRASSDGMDLDQN